MTDTATVTAPAASVEESYTVLMELAEAAPRDVALRDLFVAGVETYAAGADLSALTGYDRAVAAAWRQFETVTRLVGGPPRATSPRWRADFDCTPGDVWVPAQNRSSGERIRMLARCRGLRCVPCLTYQWRRSDTWIREEVIKGRGLTDLFVAHEATGDEWEAWKQRMRHSPVVVNHDAIKFRDGTRFVLTDRDVAPATLRLTPVAPDRALEMRRRAYFRGDLALRKTRSVSIAWEPRGDWLPMNTAGRSSDLDEAFARTEDAVAAIVAKGPLGPLETKLIEDLTVAELREIRAENRAADHG